MPHLGTRNRPEPPKVKNTHTPSANTKATTRELYFLHVFSLIVFDETIFENKNFIHIDFFPVISIFNFMYTKLAIL